MKRLAVLLLWLAASTAQAQEQSVATSAVFKRYSPYVRKVQVIEGGSSAKASIGSGFFATKSGHLITNYHVISSVITRPDHYRAEVIDPAGAAAPASVVAIDVVHDLAILKVDATNQPFLELGRRTPTQGERLYSLGFPRDLGLSIVEGTFNGLLQHTLYPRIHVTASLNPGMSGGPTIDDRGRVVGLNVSTEGNQLSFLVPADRAIRLLAQAIADSAAAIPTLQHVGDQLRAHQDAYLQEVFANPTFVDLGPFKVATQPAAFFRCWGNATNDDEKESYSTTTHRCATEDDIYLDDEQTTGTLWLRHELIASRTLNTLRFQRLYARQFGTDHSPSGEEQFVTNWKCTTRNVRNDSAKLRAILCLRRYRKLGELYDASLQVAMLGTSKTGLVSTLNMTGVTYENVGKLTERYLGFFSWR